MRPCCMMQPTGAVSLQYGGGGTHGSNWQQAAGGAQPLVQTLAAREPAGHAPLSGASKHGGGAPPQQGTTQNRPGPQVDAPHATSSPSSPPAPESPMLSPPPAPDSPAPATPASDEEPALPALEPPEPELAPPCPVGAPSPELPQAAAADTTASSATTLREACISADGCNSRASVELLRLRVLGGMQPIPVRQSRQVGT